MTKYPSFKRWQNTLHLKDPGLFSPDPDQTFFPESGSRSAKNPDPMWKNPDPDQWKNPPKTGVKVEKSCISYFVLLTKILSCLGRLL